MAFPCRLFTLHDVPLLQADLALMQAMFYAGGAGLDHEVVERLCQPAAEAVLAMSQDTGTLVANLTRAKSQPLGATARGKGVIHPDVMLRVLCHRADHAASKYLKKE